MKATRPSALRNRPRKIPARDADLETFRDITDDVIESDFVPYACLFDEATIASKNGELLQILKITGLGFDAQRNLDLRAQIRATIQQCLPDESYAIWLHTLRRQKQLLTPAQFPDRFSQQLDRSWSEMHPASASYVNELYITVVKAVQDPGLSAQEKLTQRLVPGRLVTYQRGAMEEARKALTATMRQCIERLSPFGARLLSVVERDGGFYGEHLEFLEKLINLEERAMPVPLEDLSGILTSGEITFGHSSMEVRTAEGKRRFASILTIKEYKESTLKGIDQFLDIPCELIVSQCFDFIGGAKARESYEDQARYLAISGDKQLAEWMEIDRLMNERAGRGAYGEQQTTLFLIASSIKQLENSVRLAQKALNRLGVVAIREDLRFEECYWAQLPGNFNFISRKHSVDTQHIAGFATVQTEPMGNAAGSPWGPPVSLLTTVQDAPYFFNFHRGASAHTIVLGTPRSGRSSIAHFLLAQARHLPLSIWYLDAHGRAAGLIEEMGGQYHAASALGFNPFALTDSPANREFLAVWLSTLFDPTGAQLTRTLLEFFQSMVAQVMALPAEQRRLSALLPSLRAQDALLANQLQRFCAGGEYGALLDAPVDRFSTSVLSGWDLSPYVNDTAIAVPLASYLLHRLTIALDGQPALLVLDEGFAMLDSPLFAARSAGWLDYLSQRNAAAMLMTDDIAASANRTFTPALTAKAASILAMPDAHAGAEYAMGFGFTNEDLATLHYMQPGLRQVLLKRGEEATLLKMDLSSLGAQLTVLSGRAPVVVPQKTPADLLSELMGYGAPA